MSKNIPWTSRPSSKGDDRSWLIHELLSLKPAWLGDIEFIFCKKFEHAITQHSVKYFSNKRRQWYWTVVFQVLFIFFSVCWNLNSIVTGLWNRINLLNQFQCSTSYNTTSVSLVSHNLLLFHSRLQTWETRKIFSILHSAPQDNYCIYKNRQRKFNAFIEYLNNMRNIYTNIEDYDLLKKSDNVSCVCWYDCGCD